MNSQHNTPEKESKDKPVTQPEPRTNRDKEKEDPRKSTGEHTSKMETRKKQ